MTDAAEGSRCCGFPSSIPRVAVFVTTILLGLIKSSSGVISGGYVSATSPDAATTSTQTTYTLTIAASTFTGSEKAALALASACGSVTLVAISGGGASTATFDFTVDTEGTYKLCMDDGDGTVVEQTAGDNDVAVTGTSAKMVSTFTPVSGTSGVAISFTFTAGVAGFGATDKFEFKTSCGTAGTLTAFGSATTSGNTLAKSHTISGAASYKLCCQKNGLSDHVEQSAAPQVSISPAATGSDPIIQYGDKKWYIWLPPGQMVTMIQTPDLAVHATTFGKANSKEQWFGRFLITRPTGQPVVDINIKKDIMHFNKSTAPYRSFETLDVSLEGNPPLQQLPPVGQLIQLQNEVHNVFFTMMIERMYPHWQPTRHKHHVSMVYGGKPVKVWVNHKTIGKALRECVELWCPSVNVLVCSSPANEYHGFPKLMTDYAHLDMILLDLNAPEGTLSGILPEIWGVLPMSESTKAFLKLPKKGASELSKNHGATELLNKSDTLNDTETLLEV